MKKINLLTIFTLILVISGFIHAQLRYSPLKLDNVWVYEQSNGDIGRVEIIDSSVIIDSIEYFGYAFAYQSNSVCC